MVNLCDGQLGGLDKDRGDFSKATCAGSTMARMGRGAENLLVSELAAFFLQLPFVLPVS